MHAMKSLVFQLSVTLFTVGLCAIASGQSPAGNDKSAEQLQALTRKIDEQNTKIDALSQQILKMEQHLSAIRPGIMIGETTPAPVASSAATLANIPVAAPASGNAHVVTKGETLTSIAKANKVGVQELQKFNHIENDRALQIGQTIMIPTSGAASPSASPSPAPPNE